MTMTPERVRVPEAVRRTGVAGDQIYLAVKHGTISHEDDERGFPHVLVDEVLTLRDRAS
jgi:hypothetical protein